MATARERLATSLELLERLQRDGRRVFHTGELTRVHRDRLIANGYLRRVTNGWLISSAPGTATGRSDALVLGLLGVLCALLRAALRDALVVVRRTLRPVARRKHRDSGAGRAARP